MIEISNEHAGHRERLLARAAAMGADNLAPHEALELILFYAIPVRDVNALAHRLIARFGSLRGVLCAEPSELTTVQGVGMRTAEMIGMVREVIDIYLGEPQPERPVIATLENAVAYAREHLPNVRSGDCSMMCLDSEGRLIHMMPLDAAPDGGIMRSAAEAALRYNAFGVVLFGWRELVCGLSQDDKVLARMFTEIMAALSVMTVDVVFWDGEDVLSLREMGALQETMMARSEGLMTVERWMGR